MAYIEPGLYTVHWAANPDMVVSVRHDYDDENVKLWCYPYENPADGQIWRVATAAASTDQIHLVNVMSGKAVCLPPLVTGYYTEWISAVQAMYSSGTFSSWNSIVSKYPSQTSQLVASLLGAGHNANDLYYALGGGKKDDAPKGVTWGSVTSTQVWNAMQALNSSEKKYANGTEPVQATLKSRDNRFRWEVADGVDSARVSWYGGSYVRYTLRSTVAGSMFSGNPSYAVLCNNGFATTQGEKIAVWGQNASSSTSSRSKYADLIFVPFQHGVPDGTYQIAASDGSVLGLANETKDNYARLTLVSGTDSATPPARTVWQITESESEGYSLLRNLHSGSYATGSSVTQAENVTLYQWNEAPGSSDLWGKFLIEPMSSTNAWHKTYAAGSLDHPFRFRPLAGSQLVLSYGRNSGGRYLLLENIEKTPAAQTRFYLRPVDAPAVKEVGSASDIAISTSKGGIAVTQATCAPGADAALWASWLYQPRAKLRWRVSTELPEGMRPIVTNEAGYTEEATAGLWFGLDGDTANEGLGDKAGTGFDADQIGGRCWAPTAITFSVPEALDRPFTLQVGVRGVSTEVYGEDLPATGPEIVGSITVYPPVEAEATACTWSPDGLRVGYEITGGGTASNYVRVDSIQIGGSEVLVGPETLQDAPASGFVTVPVASLSAIPYDGQSATVVLASGQTFGVEGSKTSTVTVSYSADHGALARPSMLRQDGYKVRVSLGAHEKASVWYEVTTDDGVRYASGDLLDGGVFECYPPLNVRCRVYAVVEDGSSWSTYAGWLPTVAGDGEEWEMLNWAGGWFRMRIDPTESYALERSYETVSPDGRDYQPVIFTGPKTQRISLGGLVHDGHSVGHDTFADFEAAVRAGHVVYRSPYGRWCREAVVSASAPRLRTQYGEVSIELIREDA